MPHFDFMTGLTLIATVCGLYSLFSSSRVTALKSQIVEMKAALEKVTDRLVLVENERDSHKRDADGLRIQLIEALTENKNLREKLSAIKTALRARAESK